MSVLWCHAQQPFLPPSTLLKQKSSPFRCCAVAPDNKNKKAEQTPQILRVAVTAATELLRVFSPDSGTYTVVCEQDYGHSVSGIDDVIRILESDYKNAYFVTGTFTSGIYAEDCTFEDPTIKFSGKELYSRNLKLLVPFFEDPSILLQSIEKVGNGQTEFVKASWKLRCIVGGGIVCVCVVFWRWRVCFELSRDMQMVTVVVDLEINLKADGRRWCFVEMVMVFERAEVIVMMTWRLWVAARWYIRLRQLTLNFHGDLSFPSMVLLFMIWMIDVKL